MYDKQELTNFLFSCAPRYILDNELVNTTKVLVLKHSRHRIAQFLINNLTLEEFIDWCNAVDLPDDETIKIIDFKGKYDINPDYLVNNLNDQIYKNGCHYSIFIKNKTIVFDNIKDTGFRQNQQDQ